MKLISLSIFVGLALIAGVIHYKPADRVLSCSIDNSCSFIKGKYMIEVDKGRNEVNVYDIKTGDWTSKDMRYVN